MDAVRETPIAADTLTRRSLHPPEPGQDQHTVPQDIHDQDAANQRQSPPFDMPGDVSPLLPAVLPMPARYFEPKDLTEKPRVSQDNPAGLSLLVPDISPQPAIVRLLINEQGEVDRVEVENSQLSEQAERFVIDAFAKIRFTPGKVGDLPVKSLLRIEVTLESAVSPPASTSILSVTPIQQLY
ncbi:hypothetical protein [Janthinobacterium sp. 17J80-10]|uniref:energy transducer TonB n=1 Tax=Janthinobacterium sp. 17J80-10 TaxID=2497863 RepID=UPI0010059933|nr:hypothetical protein [Janthinobacterium sp. 17J80-10]QAU33794.1 hypothetical protein EKL02_06125 [Janthinobacterium sp. 17J80-10]